MVGTTQGRSNLRLVTEADPSTDRLATAYARVRERAARLEARKVRPVRVHVGNLVQTILGALPMLHEQRSRLSGLGDFDMAHLDDIEDLAYALAYLHSKVRQGRDKAPGTSVRELVAARRLFAAHATALSVSGVFEAERVASLVRGKSHRDLCYDVIGLSDLFLERWSLLENNVFLTHEQLTLAKGRASLQLSVFAERARGAGRKTELARERDRVYTLACVAYAELRAALAYVGRRDRDASASLPSLYQANGRRKPKPAPRGAPERRDSTDRAAPKSDKPLPPR